MDAKSIIKDFLLVYPNPSNGKFQFAQIDHESITKVTLTNTLGQTEVYTSESVNTAMKGLLVAQVQTATKTYFCKIEVR